MSYEYDSGAPPDVWDSRSTTTISSDVLPEGTETFEVHGYCSAKVDVRDNRHAFGIGAYGYVNTNVDVIIFWEINNAMQKILPAKIFNKGTFFYGTLTDFSETIGINGQVWFNTMAGAPVKIDVTLTNNFASYVPVSGTVTVKDAQGNPIAGEVVELTDYDLRFVTGIDGEVGIQYTQGTYNIKALKGAVTKSLTLPGSIEFQYAGIEVVGVSYGGYPLLGAEITITEVGGDDEHKGYFSNGVHSNYRLKPNTTYEINILGFTMQVSTPDEGELLSIVFDLAHAIDYGWTPPSGYPTTMGDIDFYIYDSETLEPVQVLLEVYDDTLSFRFSTDSDGRARVSLFTTPFTIEIDDKRYLKHKESVTLSDGQTLTKVLGMGRRVAISIR